MVWQILHDTCTLELSSKLKQLIKITIKIYSEDRVTCTVIAISAIDYLELTLSDNRCARILKIFRLKPDRHTYKICRNFKNTEQL